MGNSPELEKLKEEFEKVSKEVDDFSVNRYRAECDRIMKPYCYEAAMVNFGTNLSFSAKQILQMQEEIDKTLENNDSTTLKK